MVEKQRPFEEHFTINKAFMVLVDPILVLLDEGLVVSWVGNDSADLQREIVDDLVPKVADTLLDLFEHLSRHDVHMLIEHFIR
jgi:hypothetical protein